MLSIDTIRELVIPTFKAVRDHDWSKLQPVSRHFPYYTLEFKGCDWLNPTAYFWPENSNKKGKRRVYVTKRIGNCPYLRMEYFDRKYIQKHIKCFDLDALASGVRHLIGHWIIRCEPKQHYPDIESWAETLVAIDKNNFKPNKPSAGKWKVVLDPCRSFNHHKTLHIADASEMVCTLSATNFEEIAQCSTKRN